MPATPPPSPSFIPSSPLSTSPPGRTARSRRSRTDAAPRGSARPGRTHLPPRRSPRWPPRRLPGRRSDRPRPPPERPCSSVGPTESPWMLKPRRRTMPATRVRTPGWSTTTAVRTRRRSGGATALGVLIWQLREVVETLAQGHDRVDVRLRVDAEVDQDRPRRPLCEVEGLLHLLRPLDADARQAVRVGQLDEVRHVAEVDLRLDA